MINFIKNTQPKIYEDLIEQYKDDTGKLLKWISSEISSRGVIDVLRKGIKDRGSFFDLAYYEPNSGLNPDIENLFNQNIFTLIRQLKYSSENKILLILYYF